MQSELLQYLVTGVGVASVTVFWDLGRRWLQTKLTRDDREARAALDSVLFSFEQISQRNDKALANFLKEMGDVTRYTERSRRDAEGQALGNARGRR